MFDLIYVFVRPTQRPYYQPLLTDPTEAPYQKTLLKPDPTELWIPYKSALQGHFFNVQGYYLYL